MRTPIPAGWIKEFTEFIKSKRLCQSTVTTTIPGRTDPVNVQCELPDGHKSQHLSHVEITWKTEQYLRLE